MHLFLIRHGETEHNVAGLLAGVTDSRLTNHGVLQAQRLGASLIQSRDLHFTNVYSSDLQRAHITANEICLAQNRSRQDSPSIEVVTLDLLREQDFGSLELVSWSSRHAQEAVNNHVHNAGDVDFRPKETVDAMKTRAITFLDDFIVPLLLLEHEEKARVAVVSHGLFLAQLWRMLLSKFGAQSVTVDPNVAGMVSGQPIEYMSWSNTGCLEVDISVTSERIEQDTTAVVDSSGAVDTSIFACARMEIRSINDKRHLLNLKRSGGGLGSAAHDHRQQNISSFFTKATTNFK